MTKLERKINKWVRSKIGAPSDSDETTIFTLKFKSGGTYEYSEYTWDSYPAQIDVGYTDLDGMYRETMVMDEYQYNNLNEVLMEIFEC